VLDELDQNYKLKCLSHEAFKLIILDNSMPVMSGIEVAVEIRNRITEGKYSKDLMLVLLTGDTGNYF
jgi:CheY-like chemotaxis protein